MNYEDDSNKSDFEKQLQNNNHELILFSFENKTMIHLALKDKSWRNGFVKEIKPDFFMFEDRENGIEPIFYLQVYKVSPYADRERGGDVK
jgi:hypothetical protein